MTEDRRKEIALKVVEQMVMENGIRGVQQARQDLGNQAKKIGITTEEAFEFYESFVPKFLGRVFGYSHVGLTTSKKFQIHDDESCPWDKGGA